MEEEIFIDLAIRAEPLTPFPEMGAWLPFKAPL